MKSTKEAMFVLVVRWCVIILDLESPNICVEGDIEHLFAKLSGLSYGLHAEELKLF